MGYKTALLLIAVVGYFSVGVWHLKIATDPPYAKPDDIHSVDNSFRHTHGDIKWFLSTSAVLVAMSKPNVPIDVNGHYLGMVSNVNMDLLDGGAAAVSQTKTSYLGNLWHIFSDPVLYQVEAEIPEDLRNGEPLYLYTVVHWANNHSISPLLRSSNRITVAMTPEELKNPKRFLLEDPCGEELKRRQQLIGEPEAVQHLPPHIAVQQVIFSQPLERETAKQLYGQKILLDSDLGNTEETRRYQINMKVSHAAVPSDEFIPLKRYSKILPDTNPKLLPKEPEKLKVQILWKPQSPRLWRLFHLISDSLELTKYQFGFSQYDIDSLQLMLVSHSPFKLVVFYLIILLHFIFEILAISSEVKFWRKTSLTDAPKFSIHTLLLDVVNELVILVYLRHLNESKLIQWLILVRIILNLWKLNKLCTIRPCLRPPFITLGRRSAATETEHKIKELEAFEWKCMMRLVLTVTPIILATALYQLYYVPQTSWMGWVIHSAALCAYTGGFITMTPQVVRNYKLKAADHMPWRVLTYKFLNTFIDDLFSLIIRIPKMHRASVFRDDIIFVICIFQMYKYRGNKPQLTEKEGKQPEKETKKVQ